MSLTDTDTQNNVPVEAVPGAACPSAGVTIRLPDCNRMLELQQARRCRGLESHHPWQPLASG
jgi:hypothetical protein